METSHTRVARPSRGLWRVLLALLAACAPAIAHRPPAALANQPPAPVLFTRFASAEAFAVGTLSSLEPSGEALTLSPGALSGTWQSPVVAPGFLFTQLVSSWNADTPPGTWLRVDVQALTQSGRPTDWYALALWALDDHVVQRTSLDGQSDPDARVATDTLIARDHPLVGYSLRVTLERSSPEDPAPTLRMLGAVASDPSSAPRQEVSPWSGAGAVELAVPAYSQMVHAGRYPEWGGGGEAWCSPTSTQMVVEYWGRQPSAEDLAWVAPGPGAASVDLAARSTYDAAYRGTGNWSFNAAYAAGYGLESFVTRLRSLAEAEQLIRAGIPVVASIRSGPGELDGFLFWGGTNGHLVVIVGFDARGNPIVNDPAAWSNAAVRRVYDRAQFERAWQRGSGGLVYVIHPADVPLPSPPADATPNW